MVTLAKFLQAIANQYIRYFNLCIVFLVSAATGHSVIAENGAYDEATIRAVIIFKIMRFTEWEKLPGPNINICAFGEGNSLERLHILEGKKINKLSLRIISEEEARSNKCHVAVLGTREKAAASIHKNNQSLLVVCDGCNQPPEIASVELITINNRVRFNVDLNAAQRDRVKLSSDLLVLANEVRGSK